MWSTLDCIIRKLNKKLYGQAGATILWSIINALESPWKSSETMGYCISMSDTKIICAYENIDRYLLLALKSTISWFVLVNRHEAAGAISLSRGTWERNVFRFLQQLEPANWVSCWVKMVSAAVVVPIDSITSQTPLLSTSFSLACLLACVHTPLHIEGGFIWHGGFSSLVPMARHSNGSILWHVESLEGDGDFFRLHDIEALRGAWYQTIDMNVYRTAPAVLGWSHEGETRLVSAMPTTTPVAGLSPARFFNFSPGIQATILPPMLVSAAANLSVSPINLFFAQKMSNNYIRLVSMATIRTLVLYDVECRRAWLLPEAIVVHHMVLETAMLHGWNFPHLASSSLPSAQILLENKDQVLSEHGNEKIRPRDLVREYILNLRRIDPVKSSPGEIIGLCLNDVAMGDASRLYPYTVNLRPRPKWMAITSKVPCFLTANLGDAIVARRSCVANSECNFLPAERNYLATTIRTMECLSMRMGGNWHLPSRTYWNPCRDAFNQCDHEGNSNCWENPKFLQSIDKERDQSPDEEVPKDGVLVFGSRERGLADTVLSQWSL